MDINWQLARKRPVLEKRARIVQAIRAFFIEQNFLEVETPQRIPTNAPEFHIDAEPSGTWFLQTSPELAMKRLLAADYGNIFQLSHCWRQGERGSKHLPEYSMLEWYRPNSDYHRLMDDCEALIGRLQPDLILHYQQQRIDLTPPWPRLTVKQAFSRYSDCSIEESLQQGRFDEIVSLQIEPQLPKDRPTFLLEYPAEQASLARLKTADKTVAERVELYLGGLELANGFSELTDPKLQQRRFAAEEQRRIAAGKTPYPSAEPFFSELGRISKAAGIALGIDRLVMLLCDCSQIDEIVTFTPEQL